MRHQVALVSSFATDRLLKTERQKNFNINTSIRGGFRIETPGYLRAQTGLLLSDVLLFVSAVDAEVKKSSSSSAKTFRESIQPFLEEVLNFAEEHRTLLSNFLSTSQSIDIYRDRLVSYYDTFKKINPSFNAIRPSESKKLKEEIFNGGDKIESSSWSFARLATFIITVALSIGLIVFMMG